MLVPVMSAGIKSGVNWILLKTQLNTRATARISNVLAVPGVPSIRTWPPANRQTSTCSTTSSWPTTTLAISRRASSNSLGARSVIEELFSEVIQLADRTQKFGWGGWDRVCVQGVRQTAAVKGRAHERGPLRHCGRCRFGPEPERIFQVASQGSLGCLVRFLVSLFADQEVSHRIQELFLGPPAGRRGGSDRSKRPHGVPQQQGQDEDSFQRHP